MEKARAQVYVYGGGGIRMRFICELWRGRWRNIG